MSKTVASIEDSYALRDEIMYLILLLYKDFSDIKLYNQYMYSFGKSKKCWYVQKDNTDRPEMSYETTPRNHKPTIRAYANDNISNCLKYRIQLMPSTRQIYRIIISDKQIHCHLL